MRSEGLEWKREWINDWGVGGGGGETITKTEWIAISCFCTYVKVRYCSYAKDVL